MRISTKGRYALRIMLDLAQHETDGPVALREISERLAISDEHYLSALFRKRTGMRPGEYRKNHRK